MMVNIMYGNKSLWFSLVLNNYKTFVEKLCYRKSFVTPGDREVAIM